MGSTSGAHESKGSYARLVTDSLGETCRRSERLTEVAGHCI